VWHEYGRDNREKHWGDHGAESGLSTSFAVLDAASRNKVKSMLLGEDVGRFGIGSERSLREYERAAGICFAESFVHPSASLMKEAPIFTDDKWREIKYSKYDVTIDVNQFTEYFKEFRPNKIAVFLREVRFDFDIDPDNIKSSIVVEGVWATDPIRAKVWPYRCGDLPLEWGEEFNVAISEENILKRVTYGDTLVNN